jgi:ribose/xylose/arabinose/galactoside ABC-type transport system permease subunit
MSSGHPTAAIGMEFDAIVAVIIGGTKLERGDGWLPGSVLGVLTVGVLEERFECDGCAVIVADREHWLAGDRRITDRCAARPIVKLDRIGISPEVSSLIYRLLGVLALGIALTLSSDAFLTVANLLNVLRQASLIFLIASGLTLVILTAGLDLSIGANLGLSACVTAAAIKATNSIPVGIAAGLCCGVFIGVLNGLLITMLKLSPFIATYGMLWMVYGINYWAMAGNTIYGFPESFSRYRKRLCVGNSHSGTADDRVPDCRGLFHTLHNLRPRTLRHRSKR